MYEYQLNNNRGVLSKCTPFVLTTNKLEVSFSGLNTEYTYKLAIKQKGNTTSTYINMDNNTAQIPRKGLKAGALSVDLVEYKDNKAINKYPCTPLSIQSATKQCEGLIVYAEVDDLITRIAELESQVAIINNWIESTKPFIHQHKHTL